jgi:hypothetical protein
MVFRQPHPAQAVMDLLGDRDDPFLVALADDTQNTAGLVDGGNGQCGGLGNPQTAAIDQAEAATMDRITDGRENALDLGMGQRLRQTLLLGQSNLFLNSAQS